MKIGGIEYTEFVRVSQLEALCKEEQKPEGIVVFRMAHYIKVRRQQRRLLIELKDKFPIQFNRTQSRVKLIVKFLEQ